MRGTVSMLRLLLCLLMASMPLCAADPVSRELPALYDAEIKPLLTDAAPLLKLAPDRQAADRGGEVVLREHLVIVDEKGNRTEVTHHVYRAVAESGVSAVSRDSEAFNKKRTRLHLALARTIQPDGKSLPVREDAAFIQTPQRSADSDIYNDQGEMVLIYPDVKQGSATESIVVGEMEGRIPGEFTFQRGFGAGWPVRRDQFVLEAPRGLADRMRMTTLGSGVPEPRREELQGGARVRWTWERQDISGVRQEEQRVGMDQTGPILFISTLPDWESFIQWYLPQAEKSMELSDSLKGRIDEWTKEARSPEEITAILLRKVASEVRYVGLEFGNGDLVPRPVDVVWDNQYGDCKDKACLLAAMLRHKGITACPALINTGFPGRVERRSPDYRHFDHCITAVAGPDGKWIFCDPTIPGLAPGAIGPADGDREVLLVKAGAEWARTPAHDFGTVRHRIEAVMDAAGGLSGWATLSAEGYNAARFFEMERKSTPESLRDSLQSLLSRLATGITAVDLRRHPVSEGEPYKVEAYILIPGSGGASVPMLADAGYVPQTGNETQRDTAFPSWREVYEIEARITLPPGLAPASLPEPLKSVSNWAEASGGWEWRDGALLSRFRLHSQQDNIAPADFPAFAAQMRTVNAWISRPLPLKTGADGAPATPIPAGVDPMESLPHLTSVDGQMMLVENKYPEGANTALRRAALERSIRYFPGNQEMLYRAGSLLAWLDIKDGDPAAAIRRLDSFQESCRPHVDAEEAALGDHFRGLALNRLERRDEALSVFTKLSEDRTLSAYRRTLALYWRGLLMEEKEEPDQALALLREGMAMQEPEAENILYPPWARLLLKAGKADELKAGLKKLVEERGDAAPAVLTRMAQLAGSIPDGNRPEYLKILTELGPAVSFGQEFAAALKEAEGTISLHAAGEAIRTRLEAFLKQHPDSSSGESLPENLKTAARITEALSLMIKAGIKEKDRGTAVKMALEATLKSGPDDDLPIIVLNLIRAVNARDFEKKESALLDEVLALGEMLPKSEDNHYEAVYTRLLVLQQRGQREELRRIAEAMIAEVDEGRSWIAEAPLRLLLKDAAAAGDHQEVLRLCQVIRGYPDSRQWPDSYFYEAVVLILDGQYDGALLALDALAGTPQNSQAAMPMHGQAESLLRWATGDRAAAVKWWRDSATWWPAVLKAAEKLSPDIKKANPPPLPVIPDQDPRGGVAATAAGKKDFGPMAEFLLRLAGAGRLDPAWMREYGGVLSTYAGPGLLLQSAERELNESLTALAGSVPGGTDHLLLLLYVEEAFFRRGDWEKTAAMAARYFSLAKDLNVYSGYALRYWAVAVDTLKSGRTPLLEAFQRTFESRTDEKERPRNLWLYGVILAQDGRAEEAATMLQKELDGGQLDDSHPMMPQLRELLKESRKTSSGSLDDAAALAAMADRWVKTINPAWLDWVEPVGKEGPELVAKAVEALRGTGQYQDTTILKSAVLVLRDASQPADIRAEAVNRFVVNGPVGSADPARRSVEWNLVFTASAMPEPLRARSLAAWVLECASQGWSGTFRRWSAHPLLASATDGQQFLIRQWRDVLADGSIDRAKLKAAALSLLERDLEEGMIWSFRQLFMCLVNQDPGGAEEVMKALKQKSFQKPVQELAEQMTVELRRYLEDATELESAHAALTGVVLKSLSTEAAIPLSDADLLSGETRVDCVNASAAVRLALLLRNISRRNFDHSSLDVWRQLLWCLDPAGSGPVREAVARAVVESATSDEAAARAVELAGGCLDIDNPEQARLLEELLKPLAGRDDWTSTADWLVFAGAVKSLRTGAATDVTHVIAQIHDPELKARLTQRQIQTFLATERKTELKKFVRRTPSSTLLDLSCLAASMSAWRALDQREEVETGGKRLKSSMAQAMGTAWSLRSVRRINGILEAVTEVNDLSLVPPGLEEDLIRWVAEPKDLADARFMIAYLRKDWKTCAGLSGEVIKNHPTTYPWYFIAGKACAKMGLKDQAVPLLRTYLEKTHDEPSVPEARALLKSLEP